MNLATELRRQLEKTVLAARRASEAGARKALEALGVQEAEPYAHLTEEQRLLRRALRAQARQMGDAVDKNKEGRYEIYHLAEKCAYDHWHRMLFARFLAENQLLIAPQGVPVTLEDCRDLAQEGMGKDAWEVAEKFAAAILPQIFRPDDPAAKLEFAPEDRSLLHDLVQSLPVACFTAADSLGWVYQFWQAERKDEVNAAGNKIGADELPSVTQLFTEDYMVDFLLDNTLGAWHAGKVFGANPKLAESAGSESELRNAVALPECPWNYLRFIKDKDGKWTPASGTFDGWPKATMELKCLDPCMGSGHFVVAMFKRLVALRMAEEKSDEAIAVAAVIRDNVFGLELDPRCTQIAAFNLALTAWRRVGHCPLPAMNLACSGLAPNAREADWLELADNNEKLRRGMSQLYQLFQKASVLGSLINPCAGESDLLVAAFHELQPLLERALAQEAGDETAHEMAVIARGLAKAAEILADQFTLVATNVPYLGRGKQEDVLKDFCERVHPEVKADLATCFLERCLDFCANGGSTVLVTPQNWLFLGTYKKLRERLLTRAEVNCAVRLGPNAFQDMNWWAATTALFSMSRRRPPSESHFAGFDTADVHEPQDKAIALSVRTPSILSQAAQLQNPDARLSLEEGDDLPLLSNYAASYVGLQNGDSSRFILQFW
ncbi:MAG: type restriction enzyme methylase subunit, partial [Pedosphaera sp.]|nr:type restriction enzyme methylase subunit [Pedosphaera sp.]